MTGATAVIGIGNSMRGDDAVGSLVVAELSGLPAVHVLDAGNTPENYLQPVVNLHPARVLFVDACDFSARPGEFRLFSREEIGGLSYGLMSTHTLPLNLTVEVLYQETGAEIFLLGIQPAQVALNTNLSEPVRQALPEVLAFIRQWAIAGARPAGNPGIRVG